MVNPLIEKKKKREHVKLVSSVLLSHVEKILSHLPHALRRTDGPTGRQTKYATICRDALVKATQLKTMIHY